MPQLREVENFDKTKTKVIECMKKMNNQKGLTCLESN